MNTPIGEELKINKAAGGVPRITETLEITDKRHPSRYRRSGNYP